MAYSDYFLGRGLIATVLAAMLVVVLATIRIEATLDPANFFGTILFVAVIYYILAYILLEAGLLKLAPNRLRLASCMILVAFISMEVFNAIVITVQGGSYLPNPEFVRNFIVNKLLNLIAAGACVGLVFWLDTPPETRG